MGELSKSSHNGSNILTYPQTIGTRETKPKKPHRTLKMVIYLVLILIIGLFVYAKFIKSSPDLTGTTAQGINAEKVEKTKTAEKADTNLSWQQAKKPLPSFAPINSSSDLPTEIDNLTIPDFKDSYQSLKDQIQSF